MPVPCALHDGFKVGVLRVPAQLPFGFSGIGDKGGTVACPAGFKFFGDGVVSNFTAYLDDFLDGVTISVSEVKASLDSRF